MNPMILFLLVTGLVGCVEGNTGVNPPPQRPLADPPVPAEVPEEPFISDELVVEAPAEPPAVTAPPTVEPSPHSEPDGRPHLGAQEALAIRLLDRLSEAQVEGRASEPGLEVLPAGKRSYPNPWAVGPFRHLDQRLVWSAGERAQWSLRSALALPVSSKIGWDLTVPEGARLRFDTAVGSRVNAYEPVLLTVTVVVGDERAVVWTEEVVPSAVHRLRHWTTREIDLGAFSGANVTLEISASSSGTSQAFRYIAFFAEPVIVTNSSVAAVARTGLDVADNILLVIVDAQRADTIDPVRSESGHSLLFPTMERLVREGTSFSRAFSVGNQTRLSTFAFLQSQLPTHGHFHHSRWNYSARKKALYYQSDPPLLPRLLRDVGYRTAVVANNLFLFGNLPLGLDAGFDRLIDHRHNVKDTAWVTDSAISWIRSHANERWFLMLNYNAPHRPYSPPDSVRDRIQAQVGDEDERSVPYLGEVAWVDEHLSTVLDLLRELSLDEKTLVVLTADHGEIMDPRHDCWHSGFRSRCFHNHGKTLFDEELHVPLVFWLPGRIPAGETLKTPVSLLDLAPTILGLGDIRASESHDGRDLSKSIQEGVEPEEVPIFAQARLASAVRWGGYKYILHDRRDTLEFDRNTLYNRRRSYEELYALGEDPGELQNLANMSSPPADVLEALRARLGAVTETQREGEAGNSASWDATALLEMTAEELRALEAVEEVADEQTAVEPARWGRLVFHAGNPMVRFSGVIESAAEFQGFELLGTAPENRCHLEGSRRIRVDVGPTSELAGIRFRTSVPEAPLSFNIEQDGRVVGASHFYVGAYGLRLFDDPRRVSPWELAELSGAPAEGPRVVSSIRSGVFYWQEAQSGSVGESRLERPDELDTEVRGMMREWGYTGQ